MSVHEWLLVYVGGVVSGIGVALFMYSTVRLIKHWKSR